MKNNIIIALFYFFAQTTCWASSEPDNNNYWQCIAHDKANKEWRANSAYKRVAFSKAFEACKKESTTPTSCKVNNALCNYFSET
jgi:hypothetical protein